MAVGPGDGVRVTERAAALGHQGMHLGPPQVGADRTAGEHLAVQEQPAFALPQPAAGHAAHDHRSRHVLVQVRQQVTGRERERVADHQVQARRAGREAVAAEGAAAGGPDELHGEGLDRAEAGGQPQRDRGLGFDLAGAAGHPLGHAADERDPAGLPGHRRHQGLGRAEVVGRGEQHRERGVQVTQRRLGLRDGPAGRSPGVRPEDEGSSRLHQPTLPRRSAPPPAPDTRPDPKGPERPGAGAGRRDGCSRI